MGKSCLLYVMGALSAPSAGRISIGGVVIRTEADRTRSRRRVVANVLQESMFVEHWTVERNLRHAVEAAAMERLVALLDAWGVPRGRVAPRSLSGGERQRVSVAVALTRGCSVIVADEPSSSLDEVSRAQVVTAFEDIALEATVVVSSHERMWRAWCTRELNLDSLTGRSA